MTRWHEANRRTPVMTCTDAIRTVKAGSRLTLAILLLGLCLPVPMAQAQEPAAAVPHYKPSSRSPEPLDITSNAYGFSRNAPDALAIGDRAPDFRVPRAGGGEVRLSEALARGDVVLVFYRGHW